MLIYTGYTGCGPVALPSEAGAGFLQAGRHGVTHLCYD